MVRSVTDRTFQLSEGPLGDRAVLGVLLPLEGQLLVLEVLGGRCRILASGGEFDKALANFGKCCRLYRSRFLTGRYGPHKFNNIYIPTPS